MQRLDQHLEKCTYCAQYVAQMRQTIDSLGTLGEESIEPGKRDELLTAFRGWRGRP